MLNTIYVAYNEINFLICIIIVPLLYTTAQYITM